jgi:hypothetical protein
MNRWIVPMLACLALGACGSLKPVDFARMPQGTYGPGVDVDDGAIDTAVRALDGISPRPTDPARLALALASVDYLAGEYASGGRWGMLDAMVQVKMQQGADEIRRTLAVAPGAKSQQVVDSLLAFSHAAGPEAQLAALSNPIYTLGAQATLNRLKALPPLPQTASALVYASNNLSDDMDGP